jgi:hypothetical protein
LLETFRVKRRKMLIGSGHVIAQCGGKILLVSEHNIYIRLDAAIHFLGAFLSTD